VGVYEGGLKPESTLGFVVSDEPVRRTATTFTVGDKTLEDAPALASFING
jgi:hypothetical protein